MTERRHAWSTAQNRIQLRMAELRLDVVDLARASGLSEKHVRNLLNGTDVSEPRDKTKWALCDALKWTTDSIDRILDGGEPVIADPDDSGEVSPLERLDGRLTEIESMLMSNLTHIRNQQTEMEKFWRLQRRLEGEVRAAVAQREAVGADLRAVDAQLSERLEEVEKALAELRRASRPDDAAQS